MHQAAVVVTIFRLSLQPFLTCSSNLMLDITVSHYYYAGLYLTLLLKEVNCKYCMQATLVNHYLLTMPNDKNLNGFVVSFKLDTTVSVVTVVNLTVEHQNTDRAKKDKHYSTGIP